MQCAKNEARLQAAIDFAESEELFKASGLQMQCAKNEARLQAAIDFAESEELFKASVNERRLHFINCQLKMQIKKSRGRRYTMDDKIFALSFDGIIGTSTNALWH
ncbi:hypothetical protein QE152_g39124 [Popillia japonica]|uniref:Uncharacterized protein n=1 Tax=Popillia japonica TaxID=7064 RepID=A0AAW1HUZ2_POPJA